MNEFLPLELKKFNFKHHLKGVFFIILGMLLFESVGIFSGNYSNNTRDSYDPYLPHMISLLTISCFIIYSSVFTVNLIIGEYSKKTILILFSYPVNRQKIILIKLGIVSFFTMLCIVLSNLCCHIYLFGMDAVFDFVDGAPDLQYLLICFKETAYSAIMGGILCVLPFAAGMLKKSIPAAFISSVVVSGIFFEAVGLAPDTRTIAVISIAFTLVCLLSLLYTIKHNVERLD